MDTVVEKARKVQVILFDVDGILTDGSIILGNDNIELKAFNAQDGLGITLAKRAGIKVGIITGRYSNLVKKRANELDLDIVSQGHFDKRIPLKEIVEKNGLKYQNIAYIGDDILDIPILKLAGFSATANNGVPEVKEVVDFVSKKNGGQGAVREIIEFILKCQNRWHKSIKKILENQND